MKYSFEYIDNYIDTVLNTIGYLRAKRAIRYIGSFMVLMMLGFCTAHFVIRVPQWHERQVHKDLQHIARAVTAMDKDCRIVDMRVGIHLLTPLTQKLVSEHELSNTVFKYPENWRGAYLAKMPLIQGKPYQLLKTDKGLFVVPGSGVVLPNGMMVGRDIIWQAQTDVAALTRSGGPLFYRGVALALKVAYGRQPAPTFATDPLPRDAKAMNGWLVEFNQAMPFAQNETSLRTA